MAAAFTKKTRALRLVGIGGFVLMFHLFFVAVAMAQTAASHHGPMIMMVRPAGNEALSSPCDIRVRFDRRGHASVDLSTLQVTVLKLWEIDIAERVRPYASLQGIAMTQVELPRGEHTFRIAIADVEGRVSAQTLTVRVE